MEHYEKLELILKNRLHIHKAAHSIFNTPDGEVIIDFLMKECGLTKPKIITDPNLLLVRQGQQHIVLSLLRILGMSQQQITNQIRESQQHEELLDT